MLTILDSHVSRRDPASVVTAAAYLLFYRRRSDHPLGGPLLEGIVEAANAPPADSESRPASREPSPSAGEGPRLDGFSHNGSSSAFTVAGLTHHVGDGGSAITLDKALNPGASQLGGNRGRPIVQIDDMDDELPGYQPANPHGPQSIQPLQSMELDEDEGIDTSYPMQGPVQPWNDNPMWSFENLESGRPAPSQMMAVPPGSLDFNHSEEDLFENGDNDGASTKAEGGDGSSAAGLSGPDERMKDFDDSEDFVTAPFIATSRTARASAPPPLAGDEDEEDEDLPVVELRVDEDDLET